MEYSDPNKAWMPESDRDGYDVDRIIRRGCMRVVLLLVALIVAIIVCVTIGGCTTVREVTVERVRTDTLLQSSNIRDSIYLRDSVIVREKGDTLWVERWHTAWRERLVRDTIYRTHTDTLVSITERVKEVRKPLTWWQRTRMAVGDVAVIGGVVLLAVGGYRRLR